MLARRSGTRTVRVLPAFATRSTCPSSFHLQRGPPRSHLAFGALPVRVILTGLEKIVTGVRPSSSRRERARRPRSLSSPSSLAQPPILQSCDRVRKLRGRIWSLGVFQQPLLVHELVLACNPPSPAAPTDQQHHPVTSRLVCCPGSSSLRVGSPPGSSHCGNWCACVLVKAAVPKTRSNQLFWPRQQVFVGHLDWCANEKEKKEKLDSRHCLRPHRKGAWGSGRRRRNCSRRAVVSAAFSGAGTHLHPSPVSAPVSALWEFSLQNRLALRERHRPARTDHSADLGGSHLFQVLQQRAEQLRGAVLGAPFPAGPLLR